MELGGEPNRIIVMCIPQSLLDRIEERLQSGDITNFRIGITEDWKKRERDYLGEYTLGDPIASGEEDTIREAEAELIKWTHSHLAKNAPKVKCDNQRGAGGEGAKNPNTLYIVAKEHLSFLHSQLQKTRHRPTKLQRLFNFEPAELEQYNSIS